MKEPLVIATRKSALALKQAHYVKEQLKSHYPDLNVALLALSTEGDDNTAVSLSQIGGKNLFVKTLQQAVLENTAHIAVHSLKDLSVHPHPDLTLAAVCEREDPRDALVANQFSTLDHLPAGSVVGTSSPRRTAQLKAFRPDLEVQLLRGNLQTRLKKLDNKEYTAIILAAAGLKRLGIENRITEYLDPVHFIPAIAQGAIGIECRSNNLELVAALKRLEHARTRFCVTAERVVNQHLKGDCHTPIGAHASINDGGELELSAVVGSLDGKVMLHAHHRGLPEQALEIGQRAAKDLLNQGAKTLF